MSFPIKISVIVPIYNMEQYVERCVDSLVNQTMKEMEIILVDDGSTDSSWEIIQKYKDNSSVKLFKKENGGLSDARNHGIKRASGDFLAFVDSDDYIAEDMFEKMYNLAEKHNAEMVICNLRKVDENGKPFNKLKQLIHLPEKIVLTEDFSLFGEASSFACNKIFRKELFDNETFPVGLHFEDIATIPKLILKCKTIAKTNEYLYNYFERTGSITQNFSEKGMDMFKAIALVKEEYVKSPFKDNKAEWKRFVIYQGFYSFLAYFARVKDRNLKWEMYKKLNTLIKKEEITKKEILSYKRLNKNYIQSLSPKKSLFYLLYLAIPKILINK